VPLLPVLRPAPLQMPETDEPSGESVPCACPLSLEVSVIVLPESAPVSVVVFPVPSVAVTPLTVPVGRITMFQNPALDPANVPHKTFAEGPPAAIGAATNTPVTMPLNTIPLRAPAERPPVSTNPLLIPFRKSDSVGDDSVPVPEAEVPSTKTGVPVAAALLLLAT
jgi:hypothetical protein